MTLAPAMTAARVRVDEMPDPLRRNAEFVERKGVGHPDTICDAVAEAVSQALSRAYLARFGRILHHNVDKVLLIGGESAPHFGGGRLTTPIAIVLAGRATARVGSDMIPVAQVALDAARACVRRTLRYLDPDRDVTWDCRIRSGSVDLTGLFRRTSPVPLANDTSAGVGFAPLSPLEAVVRDCERLLTSPETRPHPACGEDVKVAGVRCGDAATLTVACAAIDRHVPDLAAYRRFRDATGAAVRDAAGRRAGVAIGTINVNAADDLAAGDYYLTVTGTSAESGDDGETGRGNRANGLIAVGRPMSMEATAGKNPVNHVGKLYNVLAQELADELVRDVAGVAGAECVFASRIGAPITEPALAQIRIAPVAGADFEPLARAAEQRARQALERLPGLWRRIVDGEVTLF